jgi:hypothetical protein
MENKLQAFLASPFAIEYIWIRDAVAAACRESNVGLKVADEAVIPGESIIDRIHQDINECDFTFAVLTGLNPNVLYELGRLKQASKPTILLTSNGSRKDLPFDVRSFYILFYEDDPATRSQLIGNLRPLIARVRQALNPQARSTDHLGHMIMGSGAPDAGSVQGMDFERLRQEAERQLGKAGCRTIEIVNYDSDDVKGWNQTLTCPCGDQVIITLDLNGEITRVQVQIDQP